MKHPGHFTYANVVATLALFLVLGGGTALASFVITSNDQVGPDTISGHNPPAGDAPNLIAGSVDAADLAPNAQICRTSGLLTMHTGDHGQVLCHSKSLKLRAVCRINNSFSTPGARAQIRIRTAIDHAFFSANGSGGSFVGRDADLNVADQGVTAVAGAAVFDIGPAVYSATLVAGAPDGSQLAGDVGFRVTTLDESGNGTCEFVVGVSE